MADGYVRIWKKPLVPLRNKRPFRIVICSFIFWPERWQSLRSARLHSRYICLDEVKHFSGVPNFQWQYGFAHSQDRDNIFCFSQYRPPYALIIERQKSLCKCKKRLFFKTSSYIIYRYNIIGKHQWLNLPIDFYGDNFPIVCDIFLLLENRYEALKMAENYRLGHKPSGLRDTVR